MSRTPGPAPGSLRPGFRLWLADAGEGIAPFGPGRWQLLQAIERCGSLRAAAADLAISYRKAWGDLRASERQLGIKLVETRRGGLGGGDTQLTLAGRDWLRAYDRFQASVERAVSRAFVAHFRDLLP
jgi:molybdate transport system regulatory protein